MKNKLIFQIINRFSYYDMFHAKSSSIINSMTGHLPFTKGQWHLFRGKPDLQGLAEDKIDVLIFY